MTSPSTPYQITPDEFGIRMYQITPDQFGDLPDKFIVNDHMGEVDINGTNNVLDQLNQYAIDHNTHFEIIHHQIPADSAYWSNIKILFSAELQRLTNFNYFVNYRQCSQIDFKNFICCFNGSPHVGRKLLLTIINRYNWFNTKTVSKNFSFPQDQLDGHIDDFTGDCARFYRKFFIEEGSDFYSRINSFGYEPNDHWTNICTLESRITQSFINIVSESIPTSYVPFITEKFLYSIVTQGLFLSYAQPNWHAYLEKYYGFKLYKQIFDYRFDSIVNPVERVIELMGMISKFSFLTPHEWHDLYLLEKDAIEYNYNHYYSGNYLGMLKKFDRAGTCDLSQFGT
jgi:hypothetical protein